MNNCDLLITWHESCDYPLARLFLDRYHKFFNKIIIYFSKHYRQPVYTEFLKKSMKYMENILFLDPIEYKYGEEDWRQVATIEMLKHNTSDWIASIEQDFFAKDYLGLLQKVEQASRDNDLIGWMNHTNAPYIHPSFFFAKRSLIKESGSDFTPHPEVNGGDHFAAITWKAKELGKKIKTIQEMGYEPNIISPFKTDCFHLGGVNQNELNGLDDGFSFHRVELFMVYNYWGRTNKVEQDPRHIYLSKKLEEKLKILHPEVQPTISGWSIFFQ